MKEAAASNKIFQVYVTSSLPDNNGYRFQLHNKLYCCNCTSTFNFHIIYFSDSIHREEMCQSLQKLGISCVTILDSAVGYVMEQVDMVMVGAEGVAESGGVINKVSIIM